jgi:hypothetical protein
LVLAKQNNEYREFFSREFIAYDPSTIDELPLLDKLKWKVSHNSITLTSADCWPVGCTADHRISGRDIFANDTEINIPLNQIEELNVPIITDSRKAQTSIQRQVRSRDFRLIEQSKGLIAFRPTLGGRWSGGVRGEIEHVYRHLKKPFYVIKGHFDGDLDEGTTLGWEYGSQYWGTFDLSTPEKRNEAFQAAKRALIKNIDDMARE